MVFLFSNYGRVFNHLIFYNFANFYLNTYLRTRARRRLWRQRHSVEMIHIARKKKLFPFHESLIGEDEMAAGMDF